MKILIMSITAGEGHNSTAKAMRDYFETKGIECGIIDTYGYINPALQKLVSEGYLIASNKAKLAYEGSYRLAEKRHKNAYELSATRIANMVLTSKIHGFIEGYAPDVIIYTHTFAGIIVDILKQKELLNAVTIGIVTDFTIHPFWEECLHSDYVVTANRLLTWQMLKKGFLREQVIPFGIPINPKFSVDISKTEARSQLGLDLNRKTILLMGGSMGYGNMKKTVQKLDDMDEDFQLICVCGNNVSARAKINELNLKKKVLNLGFVNNVDLLMDASNCIISKPGGLTTSEALAKRLPMIIVNPIPGQEERNTEFLLNAGVAMATSPTCTLEEALYQLLNNEGRLENMRGAIDLIRKPNSTRDICEFALYARPLDFYDEE